MKDAYNKDTGEYINTDTIVSWMGRAGIAAPNHNPAIESCYFKSGVWIIVGQDVAKQLDDAKKVAFVAIDQQAGKTRLKYITDVTGQSETYLLKASDAAAYKAAAYPSASIANYPMVQAEAKAIYGSTPAAAQYQLAADGILATQAQWMQLSAAIEQQRRSGKIAAGVAVDVDTVKVAEQAALIALAAL